MANKRICISNETFGEWQQLRKELCIQNDSLLACFCYRFCLVPHWQVLVQNTPAPLQGHLDFRWQVALQLQDGRSFRANMHNNSLYC